MHVFLEQVTSYELQTIIRALRPMLQEVLKNLSENSRVVIKPNLLTRARPEEAITTHPVVLEALILLLREKTQHLLICDSPGGSSSASKLEEIFKITGLEQLCLRTGVDLSRDTTTLDITLKGKHPVTVPILKVLFDADLVINVAKCKTHALMTYTGAVKNQFGAIHGLAKAHQHLRFKEPLRFAEHLLDLSETLRFDYHLIDGITSMEGNGPSGGTPVDTGFLAGSSDPYTLDAVVAELVGLPLKKLPSVLESKKRSLIDPDIQFPLKSPETFSISPLKLPDSALSLGVNITPAWLPKKLASFIKRNLLSKPFILKQKCIGCMKCQDICPANTIDRLHKKASIDYENCISCFCCHEICPVQAIDIRRGFRVRNERR